MQKYTKDECVPLSETCMLAIERINFYQKLKAENKKFKDNNPYQSVDPAPPWGEGNCEKWRAILLDQTHTLFDRYRSLFSLRNEGSDVCILAICEAFNDKSILLRHEVIIQLNYNYNPIGHLNSNKYHPLVSTNQINLLRLKSSEYCIPPN